MARLLADEGWSVFWDQAIPPGETWDTSIGRALAEAACVIVLWSGHSIASTWVREEADEAKRSGKLLPVLIEKVDPPIGFRLFQVLDLTHTPWDHQDPALDNLLLNVRRMVSGRGAEGPGRTAAQAQSSPPQATRKSTDGWLGPRARHRRRAVFVLGAGTMLAAAALLLPRDILEGRGQASDNGRSRAAALRSAGRSQRRVAVVIGMQDYALLEPLDNTISDAWLIADRLVALGFIVFRYSNLSRQALLDRLQGVGRHMAGADALVVYFAGHGFRYNGTTWLVPVDAELRQASATAHEAVSVRDVVEVISHCIATSIFLVDTCRSDLWRGPGDLGQLVGDESGVVRGLMLGDGAAVLALSGSDSAVAPAPTEASTAGISGCSGADPATGHRPPGSASIPATNVAVAFATADGGLVFDGPDRNSPFAAAIADSLTVPGLELGEFFRRVRTLVLSTTGHQQVPLLELSLDQPFYFHPVQ